MELRIQPKGILPARGEGETCVAEVESGWNHRPGQIHASEAWRLMVVPFRHPPGGHLPGRIDDEALTPVRGDTLHSVRLEVGLAVVVDGSAVDPVGKDAWLAAVARDACGLHKRLVTGFTQGRLSMQASRRVATSAREGATNGYGYSCFLLQLSCD